MASPLTPMMIGTAGAVLMGLALLAFAFDWRWLGLLPLILALPLEGIAIRLSRLRLQRLRPNAWWRALIPMLAGAALVALGMSLAREHGWGMILTRRAHRHLPDRAPARGAGAACAIRRVPRQSAEPAALMLPFALAAGGAPDWPSVRLRRRILLLGAISCAPESRISRGLTLSR
jgi:hypothetical protein